MTWDGTTCEEMTHLILPVLREANSHYCNFHASGQMFNLFFLLIYYPVHIINGIEVTWNRLKAKLELSCLRLNLMR
jgi:hypothetical protein